MREVILLVSVGGIILFFIGAAVFGILDMYGWIDKPHKKPKDSDKYPTISYEDFKTFYAINPERWDMHDGFVTCHVDREDDPRYPAWKRDFLARTGDEICVQFGLCDRIRYNRFRKRLERQERNQEYAGRKSKATLAVLNAVQSDIASLKERAQTEQSQAAEEIASILDRAKEGL